MRFCTMIFFLSLIHLSVAAQLLRECQKNTFSFYESISSNSFSQLNFLSTLIRSRSAGFLLGAVLRHNSTQPSLARSVPPTLSPQNLAGVRCRLLLRLSLSLWIGNRISCEIHLLASWTQVDGIVEATRDLAASGAIDPTEEMSGDQVKIWKKNKSLTSSQVFIFQGHKDPIVPWTNAGLIHQFYSEFVPERNIEEKSDLQATHGMVRSYSICQKTEL